MSSGSDELLIFRLFYGAKNDRIVCAKMFTYIFSHDTRIWLILLGLLDCLGVGPIRTTGISTMWTREVSSTLCSLENFQ